jgi:hypothetical protein
VTWAPDAASNARPGALKGTYTTTTSFAPDVAAVNGGGWQLTRDLAEVSSNVACTRVILTTTSKPLTLRLAGTVDTFPRDTFVREFAVRINVTADRVDLISVVAGSVIATVRVRDEPGSSGEDAVRSLLSQDLVAKPLPGFTVLSTTVPGAAPVAVGTGTETGTATPNPTPSVGPAVTVSNNVLPRESSDGSKLSTGEIVLVVLACLIFVGVIISAVAFVKYRSSARDATLEAQAATHAARSIPAPAPVINNAPPAVTVTHLDREPHSEIPAATRKLFAIYGGDDPKIVPHLQALYERDPAAVIAAVPEQHVSLLVRQLDAPAGRGMPRLVRDVSSATHRSSPATVSNRL